MEVEIVAAGGAVEHLRRDGDCGRQQNDGGAGEAAPAGWISRSQRRDLRRTERFEEGTEEGHANPFYQYPTVKDSASKKISPANSRD
jgi:hypothetical protein